MIILLILYINQKKHLESENGVKPPKKSHYFGTFSVLGAGFCRTGTMSTKKGIWKIFVGAGINSIDLEEADLI